MSDVNLLILVGRAGIDAELRFHPNGSAQANFRLATEHARQTPTGRQVTTEWHEIFVDGALGYSRSDAAKRASLIVRKGAQVYVEGRLSYRKAYRHPDAPLKAVVLATRVELVGAAPPPCPSPSSQ
jgi:single-strand DNA-binding protein